MRVAGSTRAPQSADQLVKFSRSDRPALAIAAIEALADLGRRETGVILLEEARTVGAQPSTVLVARVRALGRLGSADAVQRLLTALTGSFGKRVPQEIRLATADALVQQGVGPRAILELQAVRSRLKGGTARALDAVTERLATSQGTPSSPMPFARHPDVRRVSRGLRTIARELDRGFQQALEEQESPHRDYSDTPEVFQRTRTTLQFIDTRVPINARNGRGQFVPDERSTRIIPVLRTAQDLEKIAQAVVLRDPLLLVGETGVGKTALIRYLARLSNNSVRRFNLNGQTDKLEFVGGYKPEAHAQTSFAFRWHDGVLVDAMRDGHWIVMDDINLAEPEIVERIRYLLDAHPRLELSEHEGEQWVDARDYDARVRQSVDLHRQAGQREHTLIEEATRDLTARKIYKIHPDFRLFATMNPPDYEGRKALSPALMNRFKIKWIKELSPDDVAAILRARYRLDESIVTPLVAVYSAMAELARPGGTLGRDAGITYSYTIRHLFRLAERLHRTQQIAVRDGESVDTATTMAREVQEVYGDGLRTAGDQALLGEVLHGLALHGRAPHRIAISRDEGQRAVRIGHVVLPMHPSGGRLVPGPDVRLQLVATTATWLERIARSVEMGEKPLLIGPTGAAKTSMIRYLAHLTESEFVRVNLDAQADTSDLIGKYIPREGTQGELVWQDGTLLTAMAQGHWILLDEFNLAEPEILERINPLLDDEGTLVVTEHNTERWVPATLYDQLEVRGEDLSRLRRIHPSFHLFAAMNPERYAGRHRLSRAMTGKFAEKWMSGAMPGSEVQTIATFYLADGDVMTEPALVGRATPEAARFMTDVYLRVTGMLERDELGRGKLSGASAAEYSFSLRDLKDWARFVRRLSGQMGVDRALIEGGLYIFRDRLEGRVDKETFKDEVLQRAISECGVGEGAVALDQLDVLEEEGRSASELIEDASAGSGEGMTAEEMELAELVEKLDALSSELPPRLRSEDGLGAIMRVLTSATRAADGVRGFALLPPDMARPLVDKALASTRPEFRRAGAEVIGHLGLDGCQGALFELLSDGDVAVRLTAALVIEKQGYTFPAAIAGRPGRLPYWQTTRQLLARVNHEGSS